MASTNISFLSCRGRGMSYDMNLIHTHLSQIISDAEFRYFVTNEVSSNYMVRQGITASKKIFCKKIENLICTDISLTNQMDISTSKGKRVLVAVPFGYQFEKAVLYEEKQEKKDTLKNFSHILVSSPFTKSVFEKNYNLEGVEILDGICSPFAWEINQEECRQQRKEELSFYYPELTGKKVLAIMTNGKLSAKKKEEWDAFDFKQFIDQLDENWFILTNCKQVLNASSKLSNQYKTRLGFVSNLLSGADILYVADTLITNNSMYASCFASRRKPLYCLEYSNTNMEKYVQKNFKDAYLESLADFSFENNLEKTDLTFCEHLSYLPEKDPYEVIKNIFISDKK